MQGFVLYPKLFPNSSHQMFLFIAQPRHHVHQAMRNDEQKPSPGANPWHFLTLNIKFTNGYIQLCAVLVHDSVHVPFTVLVKNFSPIMNSWLSGNILPHLWRHRPCSVDLGRAWSLSARQYKPAHGMNGDRTLDSNYISWVLFGCINTYFSWVDRKCFAHHGCADAGASVSNHSLVTFFPSLKLKHFVLNKMSTPTCIHQYMFTR